MCDDEDEWEESDGVRVKMIRVFAVLRNRMQPNARRMNEETMVPPLDVVLML